MRKEKEVRSLECILTQEEIANLGKELASIHSEKCRSEARLKSFATQCKADIAACDAKIQSISERVNTGKEFRDVPCNITYDWARRVKQFWRQDTGEIIGEGRITEDEYQEEMALWKEQEERASQSSTDPVPSDAEFTDENNIEQKKINGAAELKQLLPPSDQE